MVFRLCNNKDLTSLQLICVSPLQGHSEEFVRRLITFQRMLIMRQMLLNTSSVSLTWTRYTQKPLIIIITNHLQLLSGLSMA